MDVKLFKVRPIFIISDKNTGIVQDFTGKLYLSKNLTSVDLIYDDRFSVEIVLISLDDENLENSHICYDFGDDIREISYGGFLFKKHAKLVLTQEYLSPKLINNLIRDFNNKTIRDFEIEMFPDVCPYCNGSDSKCPKCNGIGKIYKPFISNLTNYFVLDNYKKV